MIITATQKYTRQTPRKVREVANAVKNMPLDKAIKQLGVMERRSSLVIMKVLRQAIANAVNNSGFAVEDLKLRSITVSPGPMYKRFRAVSRGRAHSVVKRTSHITVKLEAGAPSAAAEPKPAKATKPAKAEKPASKTTRKAAVGAKKPTARKTQKK